MKFVHLSDNHLGYRQYNLQDREKDFYANFKEVMEKFEALTGRTIACQVEAARVQR